MVKEKELEAIWLLSYGGGNFERGTQKKITEVQYLSLNKVWYIGTLEQRFFRRAVQLKPRLSALF